MAAEADRSTGSQTEDVKINNENAMNVVMVGSECAPWSKTGESPFTALVEIRVDEAGFTSRSHGNEREGLSPISCCQPVTCLWKKRG